MPTRRNILHDWGMTPEKLTEVLDGNPSVRGILFGYVAEYKLRELWLSDRRITSYKKYDDHDRDRPSDVVVAYRGHDISFEVKSLQTNSIHRDDHGNFRGKFQCDASDRRTVTLPNGTRLETTCLLVGQFDIVAVNIYGFEHDWRFLFAPNKSLPRSNYHKYTPYQREHLLATLIAARWPPESPFVDEPFQLMDEIIAERSRRG